MLTWDEVNAGVIDIVYWKSEPLIVAEPREWELSREHVVYVSQHTQKQHLVSIWLKWNGTIIGIILSPFDFPTIFCQNSCHEHWILSFLLTLDSFGQDRMAVSVREDLSSVVSPCCNTSWSKRTILAEKKKIHDTSWSGIVMGQLELSTAACFEGWGGLNGLGKQIWINLCDQSVVIMDKSLNCGHCELFW